MKDPNHTNVIEVLGRNHLIAQLIEGRVHGAIPIWDQGVGLLAYYHGDAGLIARPLQLKAAENARWSLDEKYKSIDSLLLVYAWHVRQANGVKIYAMSYQQAYEVLKAFKYDRTKSWENKNRYAVAAHPKLRKHLQPFHMTSDSWRTRLRQP